jgi:DHA1 family bicyclomycin/chloramphenicol resistance-like MFS transporter
MIGLALGQLLLGPLSDKLGRAIPMRFSLILFLIATFGCIYAWDINSFLAFRVLQGIAGAGGIVLSRSVVSDLFEGQEMAKAFGIVMAVHSLAPMLSPVCGSFLLDTFDWKSIFMFLFLLGCVLVICSFCFRESLAKERRLVGSPLASFSQMGQVFRNKTYVQYVLLQGAGIGILFCYIASSPYLIQTHYGETPVMFGIWFAINAFAMALGSMAISRFRRVKLALRTGSIMSVILTCCTASVLFFSGPFWLYETSLIVNLFFLVMIFPSSAVLAMNAERQRSGSASAVLGALSFVVGGIVSPLVGIGDVRISTAILFIIGAICVAVMITLVRLRPWLEWRHRHR